MEEAAKLEIQGKMGRLNITMAGPEIILGCVGFDIAMDVRKRHPNSSFECLSVPDEAALLWLVTALRTWRRLRSCQLRH